MSQRSCAARLQNTHPPLDGGQFLGKMAGDRLGPHQNSGRVAALPGDEVAKFVEAPVMLGKLRLTILEDLDHRGLNVVVDVNEGPTHAIARNIA